jgi:hypothetical protein
LSSNIYYGDAALNRLRDSLDEKEAGASSHWQYMHSTFSYKDGELVGVRGFGNLSNPYFDFFHSLFQSPYRKMGVGYPLCESAIETGKIIAKRQLRAFNFDFLRQALTCGFLDHYVPKVFCNKGYVMIIGDGFGSLTSLILSLFPKSRVFLINLRKTLLVDLMYIKKGLPDISFGLIEDEKGLLEAQNDPSLRLIACIADNFHLIEKIPVALGINIASFQEMNPLVIEGYFRFLRKAPVSDSYTYLYCCNRLEKKLFDGMIVRFIEYPWESGDTIMIDELCPWHQTYYSFIPPFYRRFDGPIQHRLVSLRKNL